MKRGNSIEVMGARVHNLKNIDVSIPRHELVVVTGLSGSGKSSLAFDTIYAEGQRRYMETMSAYARHFLGNIERPDVERITGLSPVISIEQRTTNRNPRSTVGTITEIYDFLRLMFARIAVAYSSATGEKMVKYTHDQTVNLILENFSNKKTCILAPVVKGRKGHYKELFVQIRKKGFIHARINGKITELSAGMQLDRYKTHNIEIVIDKLIVSEKERKRLDSSVETAMKQGQGTIMLLDIETDEIKYYSRHLMCPTTGISYNEPAPHSFSFNSPEGACRDCNGLGLVTEADIEKIIPDPRLSIKKGAIKPLGPYRNSLIFWQLEAIANRYGFRLDQPLEEIPDEALKTILYGSDEALKLQHTPLGSTSNYFLSFDGVLSYIREQNRNGFNGRKKRNSSDEFVKKTTCKKCKGTRLKEESLYFRVNGMNISQLAEMDISMLLEWFKGLEGALTARQKRIGSEIIKEILTRLGFMTDVGLGYLSLNRRAESLSGGESQRIRLATQIGSQLVNVLYILDEPSIGLHHRDNMQLIDSLRKLRDKGNSIIVVEHDRDMILSADTVIDMGPGAGVNGGQVVAQGSPAGLMKSGTLTSGYLSGKYEISIPQKRRNGNGKKITIRGAKGNNLKNITASFPLGIFMCVTGVSGSGKSSLVNETLHPVLSRRLYGSLKEPLPFSGVEGTENIDKVIEVNQSPLGRTPRSNPATYTGVFSDIRKIFEQTPEAKIRGYKAGRFSFNVKGGRCETCKGAGVETIEMNFLPDVYVTCKSCNGKRYNRETLEIKFKGKSISDVLEMTINQAAGLFDKIPSLRQKLRTLQRVGLGYIKLGQPSTTLSGGESQRVKLSSELARRDTGKTLYIFDEPTTGLHFEDINILLEVLNDLVNKGNTIIVIEHNPDVIKMADHIIDMGREGGTKGGDIIAEGTPEQISEIKYSYTGKMLEEVLNCRRISNLEV